LVDHHDASAVMEQAWNDIGNAAIVSRPALRIAIEEVMGMGSGSKSLKYLLLTGIVARAVDPNIHPRAIQAASKLSGAYDAASLCKQVIVEFERTKGNLFGLLNNPFANPALCYPEHDKHNPRFKNRTAAICVHGALDLVRAAKPEEVYAALVHVLRLAKDDADSTKLMDSGSRSLDRTRRFLEKFLEPADRGARLAAAWGAILELTNERAEIKVYNPNQSDEYSSTIGDVEVFLEGALVSASKCKHRPLTADDVERGLSKNSRRVDYTFVTASGITPGERGTIFKRIADAAASADVTLIETEKDFPAMLNLLGPHRRAKLGPIVLKFLRQMHELDCASEAAALWNKS